MPFIKSKVSVPLSKEQEIEIKRTADEEAVKNGDQVIATVRKLNEEFIME